MTDLDNKTIIFGVTGSIAAFRAADIILRLVELGADVHVIMTQQAKQFITPLTLQTLSRNPILKDALLDNDNWKPGHIDIADKADLLLVAPATANTIAHFANGLASDLLSATYLATEASVMIAPAMNGKMLKHPAPQRNMELLQERGNIILDCQEGMLACGYEGNGKLAVVNDIVNAVVDFFKE